MPGHIEIGIIPQDLRQEETIVQIAKALDTLNSAVSSIFGCIDERLSENSQRLTDIRSRAIKLQGRLNHLQTNLSLKAVKLYSAAKYPASHTYREYALAIKPSIKHDEKPPSVYRSPVPISQESKSQTSSGNKAKNGQQMGNGNVQEKLQFYHVKTKPRQRSDERGLGVDRIPPHLTSVSSLLLFNSKDNPYGRPSSRASSRTQDKKELEDAPDSMLQSWHPTEIESPSNYLYVPTLGEVPQINVPLTLPDLPGIVDDERFVLDMNAQSPIAPSSVVTTPTTHLNLPSPHKSAMNVEKTVTANDEAKPNLPNLVEDATPSSCPPPPPPPPVISPLTPPAPPPPPPPPPSAEDTIQPTVSQPQPVQSTSKVDSVDNRSNLMEAIRKAGGVGRAKLRSTAEAEKKLENWSSASVGGDLMADLHAKLSLRRKGISGTMAGPLEKMSAMIPPPPRPSEATASERNSAASEQDSQPDTDDWDE